MNDDTDYTAVDEAFFRRGEEIEHTPSVPADSFEDLDDAPARPAVWPPVRARLAALAHAVPKPRDMSRRGRRIALASAGIATLCIIALAVPNSESHVAAGITQPARHDLAPAAPAPTPALAPTPATTSVHPEQAQREARSASKEPTPALAPAPTHTDNEARTASSEPSANDPAPQAHRRAPRAERTAARPEPKRARDPKRGKRHYDRGLHAWNRGDLAAARKEFVASTRAGHAAGYRALGVLFRKQGNKTQAIRAFRTYLRVAPKNRDAATVRRMLTKLERS